ncbi:hypothetical protein A0256_18245 [Mucilaginibacter sp. PAMC 26640]|nr:hypothetical protein A0256_18245 [Mucilaginibacter sp. PAMC 26640]
MPALFVFLFKVNIALLLFCAGYYLVLRHLTFYSLNRVYLISAIIFASIYPKIDLTSFAQRHDNIALPVQTVLLNWQIPAARLVKPLTQPDYWAWGAMLFWAGAALLATRLLVQLFSLLKLYRNSKQAIILNHEVRLMNGKAAPFSFWRSIYVNPENHTPADLKAILLHEQEHVNGWHTIDIMLAELSSIFYWFNPGVWLMKKAVRENIEFITDRKILNNGIDTKAYQYSLVNVSFNAATPGIVNHFNISTIKKRIIMMNAKRSSKFNVARYAFILPAVVLLLIFSFSDAAIIKPISAKINSTIQPLRKVTLNIISQADTAITLRLNTSNLKKGNSATLKQDTIKFATLTLHKADTGKKKRFSFHTENVRIFTDADSANFVVDGKKIRPADFKALDPNDILAVNVVNPTDAKALLLEADELTFDNNKKIVFVTTTKSDAGKKLLARLGNRKQINNLRITKDGVPQNISGQELVSFGSAKPATIVLNSGDKLTTILGNIKHPDLDSPVIVKGYPNTLTLKKSNGTTVQAFISKTSDSPESLKAVSITGFGSSNRSATAKTYSTFSTATVNRISDKLIIIDGKEATKKELKKLSAFDIDRMSTLLDIDTVKKYGSKAKYGVVYIYTKKAK